MVSDLFVDFDTFVAQVNTVEGAPFKFFMTEWCIDMHKSENELTTKYFLPYPYQFGYIAKRVQEDLENDIYQEKYHKWFTKLFNQIGKESIQNADYTGCIYTGTNMPLFMNPERLPTWGDFFRYRIQPFIDSSISEFEFLKYSDCPVLINLDRNAHAIMYNGYDSGEIITAILPNNMIPPQITLFCPPTEKFWFVYKDTNIKPVMLGDADYELLNEEIITSELNTTGNVYLFDNNFLG